MKKLFVMLLMLAALNARAQWVQMNNGIPSGSIYSLAVSGSNIFAGTYANGGSGGYGVFLSTNYGTNWSEINNGLTNLTIYAFAVLNTNIFVGTGGGIFLSTNNGASWTSASAGLTYGLVNALLVSGTNIIAGTAYGGVFLSTNNGANWTSRGASGASIFSLCISGTDIFACGIYGIYKSTDNGLSWNFLNNELSYAFNNTLTSLGSKLYAGNGNGLYTSTNNGTNWAYVNNTLTNHPIYSFAVSSSNIFVGSNYGVCFSSNNGTNWFNKSQGFEIISNPTIRSLLITNNYIFAGTNSNSVWRRSLSEITGIQNMSTEIPSAYSLSQNYPNPFNPSTVIRFQLSVISNVVLKVYDVQGREVQTLVNERLQPGTYEATFDGSLMNSGVYFYKITTGGYSETKRMILLK